MPLGGPELLIILVIVLIIFGAGKLPQVFGSLGKGVREFREASEGRSDTGTIAGDGAQQAGSPSSAASTAATPPNAVSDEARGPNAVSDAPQPGPTSRREES